MSVAFSFVPEEKFAEAAGYSGGNVFALIQGVAASASAPVLGVTNEATADVTLSGPATPGI